MNHVRLFVFPVESCRFHVIEELATQEYSKRAVAIHTPVSIIDILLVIAAVDVVVAIVHVVIIIGAMLSIRSTVAVVSPVFPARSSNVNRNEPLFVKIFHQEFIPVRVSLNPVSIAITFPLVQLPDIGVYIIIAVGLIVSTTCIVLVVLPVCMPSKYIYSIIYVPIVPVSTIQLIIVTVPVVPLSDHIAHDSAYGVNCSTVHVDGPLSVTIGMLVSTTVIVLLVVHVLIQSE